MWWRHLRSLIASGLHSYYPVTAKPSLQTLFNAKPCPHLLLARPLLESVTVATFGMMRPHKKNTVLFANDPTVLAPTALLVCVEAAMNLVVVTFLVNPRLLSCDSASLASLRAVVSETRAVLVVVISSVLH